MVSVSVTILAWFVWARYATPGLHAVIFECFGMVWFLSCFDNGLSYFVLACRPWFVFVSDHVFWTNMLPWEQICSLLMAIEPGALAPNFPIWSAKRQWNLRRVWRSFHDRNGNCLCRKIPFHCGQTETVCFVKKCSVQKSSKFILDKLTLLVLQGKFHHWCHGKLGNFHLRN